LDAVRTVTRAEEDFKEPKGLRGGGPSCATKSQKRKCEDLKPPMTAKLVKKNYSAKEKVDYKAKKVLGARTPRKELEAKVTLP